MLQEKTGSLKLVVTVIGIGLVIAIVGILVGAYLNKKNLETKKQDSVVELGAQKGLLGSLLFGEKDFKLSYSNLDLKSAETISRFEPGDALQGSGFSKGFFDRRIFVEGDTSFALTSVRGEPSILYIDKPIDFTNVKVFGFYLNLSDPQAVESAAIKLGTANMDNYYNYTLNNLNRGWNFLQIPINQFTVYKTRNDFNLSQIARVQFEIKSRPQNTVLANLDFLRILRNDDYFRDWNVGKSTFLSLIDHNNKIVLLARNVDTYMATLSKITGVSDFTYQATVIPQKIGRAGLFFRGNYMNAQGYYFLIGGAGTNSWSLMKNGMKGWDTLLQGTIANFNFEKDHDYKLLITAKKNSLVGSLSVDGQNYTELFSTTDDEFLDGTVGISVLDAENYTGFTDFELKR